MDIQSPHIFNEAVKDCPDDLSPIFYVDIKFNIIKTRGRSQKRLPFKAEKRVFKGVEFKADEVKINALKWFFGYERDKTQFKKIVGFDLSKIEITGVHFKRSLGYGIKSN